jgi:hypothetical protein
VDKETYRRLKEEAHARGGSMATFVRKALRACLGLAPRHDETLGAMGLP